MADDLTVDVCVVGAGIAGLTTAYLLAREGKSVAVLDRSAIVAGETIRTTAHLSSALDERYFELERLHGGNGSRLAAESHGAAIDWIERTVREEQLACDFERVDGYLFDGLGASGDGLDRELAATQRAGLDTQMVARAPLPFFHTGRALLFPRQAQIHPVRFLNGLAEAITRAGGRLCGGTAVRAVRGGKQAAVQTAGGAIVSCGAIVMATSTPVNDRVVIHTKQAAYRTYALAAAVPPGAVTTALYWDVQDPYHYVRVHPATRADPTAEGDLLIVGGEDHKTGQATDTAERHGRLEAWMRERFPMAGAIRHRWSGQVLEPVDGLGFIGRNPLDEDNVYIATGGSGNGMTHGTVAGLLLADLIAGRANPWADLYSPSRVSLGSAGTFARENANVAAHYADWLTAGDVEKTSLVANGTGAVVREGLTKLAVYRNSEGNWHECSAVCPHLGAIVSWNPFENTWDCPAHGSRFDRFGRVLNGPANENLPAIRRAGR